MQKSITKKPLENLKQQGLSLVELMVAILISMIVLAGVLQVVISSKSTFLSQEEMSYIQENARFALDIIGRDIQSAGYWGCAGSDANLALVAKTDATTDVLLGAEPVIGYEGALGVANNYPGLFSANVRTISNANGAGVQDTPDSIIIRRLDGVPRPLVSHAGNTITTESFTPFKAGRAIAIVAEDCRRAGVIRAATASATQITFDNNSVCANAIKPKVGASLICTGTCVCQGDTSFATNYLPGAMVQGYSASAYFIGNSTAVEGQPALKRMVLNGAAAGEEELALGVEDLEILYGLDTDSDSIVDAYVAANEVNTYGDWFEVYSVQVSIVFRSQNNSNNQTEAVTLLSNNYNDRFMRQVVTATYRVRNRI